MADLGDVLRGGNARGLVTVDRIRIKRPDGTSSEMSPEAALAVFLGDVARNLDRIASALEARHVHDTGSTVTETLGAGTSTTKGGNDHG